MSFATGLFPSHFTTACFAAACLAAACPARLPAQKDSARIDFWAAATPQQKPVTRAEIEQTAALLRLVPLPDTGRFDCPPLAGFSEKDIAAGAKNNILTAQRLLLLGRLHCAVGLLDQLLDRVPTGQTGLRAEILGEKLSALLRFRENEAAGAVAGHLQEPIKKGHRPSGPQRLALAQFDHTQHRSDAALQSAQAVLAEARESGDQWLAAEALSVIGRMTRDVFFGSSGKALPYHRAALDIARSLRDTVMMARELVNLSWNVGDMGDQPAHLEGMRQAAVLLQKTEDVRRKLGLIVQMGSDCETVEEGLHWMTLGHRIAVALRLTALTVDIDARLYDQLCTVGRFAEAEPYLLHAADLDGKNWGLNYRLYDLHKRKDDPKTALFYLEKAYSTVSSDYMGRNAAAISVAETQFKTGEKERLLAENERERQLLVALVGAICLLLGGAAWLFFREKKTSRQLASQRDIIEQQASDLRQLDEAKSRFFVNVSHELRTPLTLMLGPIGSMLKRGRIEGTDMALAQTAQQHGRQLLRLVSEILDLSKMASGKMPLVETAVSFQPFVMRVLGVFESHAARLGVGFSIEYGLGERLVLLVDEDKFRKIINNYLSNAFKFTPAGGSVTVRIEAAEGDRIRLAVADTGRGIHPEDLPKVFERFFQTAQPGAAAEGGTGIGLSLCRELAELMGGRVWVESEVGRGSTFFFEFPKKEAPQEARADAPLMAETTTAAPIFEEKQALLNEKPTRANGKAADLPTVLVVEDNQPLRDYLRLVLSEKFHVEAAANGQAALDFLNTDAARLAVGHAPFAIVSDVMMPVMDGFQLVERLKADGLFRQIPVVMLTARADLRNRLKALRIGVDDYLHKPFEEEELLARLDNLLRNAAARWAFSQELAVPQGGPDEPNEEQAWLAELESTVSSKLGQFDFNADLLASEMAMGRTSFFNQVKKLTGLTPNQYVQEVRFGRAKWLLETRRERSVKAVAFAVGMRDVQYFSEQFKRRFGRSPGELLD